MPCRDKERGRRYYRDNKEKVRARQREYVKANEENVKAKRREYRQKNKESIKAQDREYRQANKDKRKEYTKANEESIKAYQQKYRQANKDKLKAYDREDQQANKERKKAYRLSRYQGNKESIKAKCREYRHRKKLAMSPPIPLYDNPRSHISCFEREWDHHIISYIKITWDTIEIIQFNIRPDFLWNPRSGRNLELDLYFPEKRLAIEIQGIQHFRFSKRMHGDKKGFRQQKYRDKLKRRRCKEQGIKLIEVCPWDKVPDILLAIGSYLGLL